MAASLMPWIKPQFLDAEGVPVAGGQLYSYIAGTTTLQPTYSDEDLTIANPNPILLNAGGWSPTSIYLLLTGYKFTLLTQDDVPLWTVDEVIGCGCGAGEAETPSTEPSQDWQDIAYSAANFSASGGGTWAPTVTRNRWRYLGSNAVIYTFFASAMNVSGTLGQELRILNLPWSVVAGQRQGGTVMEGPSGPGPGQIGTTTFAANALALTTLDMADIPTYITANEMAWTTVWEIVPPA